MTSNDDFGLSVSRWLHDEAQPEHAAYLADVLAATSGTRQRPAWSSPERWLPMDLTFPGRRLPFLPPMRVVIVLALVAILTTLVLFAVGTSRRPLPAPFGPAANGSILTEGRDGDIYVSAPDGTNTRALITGPSIDVGPWFSHDGTRFLFVRDLGPEVIVMMANADGSNVRQLTEPLRAMDWYEFSPDDERLAIVHGVDGQRVLSILDIETRKMQQLTVPGLEVDNNVYWLPPNGNELIMRARPEAHIDADKGVYSIRPDGTGFREILPPRTDQAQYQELDLAHDGSHLAYWQYETDDSGVTWKAYVRFLDPATGVDRRMSFSPGNVDESMFRFSPDGKNGAIVASDGTEIYAQLVDLAGSTPARRVGPVLPTTDKLVMGFSPDGKQLVIAYDNEKPHFVDVATGGMTTGPTEWAVFSSWQRLAP